MAYRPIWLAKSRQTSLERAHFALLVPNDEYIHKDPNDSGGACIGTKFHVVGAPMVGYMHQFKRGWDCNTSQGLEKMVRIG